MASGICRCAATPVLRQAVFATVPGQSHNLGLVLATEAFREVDWQVTLLLDASTAHILDRVRRLAPRGGGAEREQSRPQAPARATDRRPGARCLSVFAFCWAERRPMTWRMLCRICGISVWYTTFSPHSTSFDPSPKRRCRCTGCRTPRPPPARGTRQGRRRKRGGAATTGRKGVAVDRACQGGELILRADGHRAQGKLAGQDRGQEQLRRVARDIADQDDLCGPSAWRGSRDPAWQRHPAQAHGRRRARRSAAAPPPAQSGLAERSMT